MVHTFSTKPCFVGLVFLFSLTGSLRIFSLSLVVWSFMMMYPGAGISSSIILSAQWTLSFWKFMSFNPGTFSSMILVIFLPIFSFPLIIFHNIHSCHMDMTALMRAHYSFQFPALHIGAGLRSIARMNAIRT